VSPRELLRPLAWSRIGLASVLLVRTTPLIGALDPRVGSDVRVLLGWPLDGQPRSPAFFALSDGTIQALCLLRTAGALGLLLGYRPLLSGLTAAVAGYLVLLQNAFAFNFTHHLLLVGAFALALTDCAATLSVRPEPPRSPATSLGLVRGLVVSIYFWAACAKMRADWFDGRTLGLFYGEGKLNGPVADLLLGTAWRRAAAGKLVVLTELSLVGLLLWRPSRWVGLAVAFCMHMTFEAAARPDAISWAMLSLLLCFVPVDGPRRARDV